MPLFSTEAFVLSTLRLGEADKLVTFFTHARGKYSGVAKGARRFKSPFGASLEPFTRCHLIAFEKGQNKLARIRQTDIVHSFQKLREQWETIDLGTRLVRLLVRITPEEEPHPELYHLLHNTLAFLEAGVDRPLSFILFMIHLMATCGYQLQWNFCARCGPKQGRLPFSSPLNAFDRKRPTFTPDIRALRISYPEGGLLCPRCGDEATHALSREALDFLQSVSKTDFASAHHLLLSTRARREVETILNDQMTYLTGKPVPSS